MTNLTVVVPTFNGARYLSQTLDSLANQTDPVDILVVDDGSTDNSVEIARRHRAQPVVLTQPNRGVAAARNRGLAVAGTTYVAFCDQDDIWHPTRTAILLQLAAETGAVAVGTAEQPFALERDRDALSALRDGRVDWDVVWTSEDETPELSASQIGTTGLDHITVERLMRGAATMTTSFMYEREAAITAGGCAPFIRAADDHVLNVNLAHLFGPLPRARVPLLLYRLHPEATTQTSPLVLPLLTLQLALRHGRALPSKADLGPNLMHLISQVADQDSLSLSEQRSLITLSVPSDERWPVKMQWLKRRIKRALRRSS